jgi:hypothetical protein
VKSVPNLISYLHEFFQNCSQSVDICFELFSFGEFVYSDIAAGVKHRQLPRPCHAAPDSRALTHTARLPTASRAPPPRPTAASLAPPSRPPRSEAADARSVAVLRRSPIAVALCRRLCAGEPLVPRRLPCADTEPPPGSDAARLRRALRFARAGRAGQPAPRTRAVPCVAAGRAVHCASGPRAISAQ